MRRLSIVLSCLMALWVTVAHADDKLTGTEISDNNNVWIGLDLGSPHVITKVGWAPSVESQVLSRVVLGVFEGANRPDFMDALPLYMIEEKAMNNKMTYADVNCSRGFRYVIGARETIRTSIRLPICLPSVSIPSMTRYLTIRSMRSFRS